MTATNRLGRAIAFVPTQFGLFMAEALSPGKQRDRMEWDAEYGGMAMACREQLLGDQCFCPECDELWEAGDG